MDIKKKISAEWIAFLLFIVLYVVVSIFHEPMYDEAQAWMIARDASWWELVFEIPHYEGHPPFWHMILALFAKSGVPFEIGLRIPGALFCIGTIWLIVFKSPFPRMVRCMLPFTYYIFFRYSIVVRPYCMTMLALCLAAILYKKKEDRPFLFAGTLLLLCGSSAYGMAFAAGICIVWLIELFHIIKRNCVKQIVALMILLICNLGFLYLMFPKEDTNAVVMYSFSTILYSLIYMFVVGPADSLFLDSGMDARLQNYAQKVLTENAVSYLNILIGLITIAVLVYYFRKYKKLLLFFIPYSVFALFSAIVYFWYHHIGLIHLFLIFVFWCALDQKNETDTRKMPRFLEKAKISKPKIYNRMKIVFICLCLGMSFAWSVFCSVTDLTRNTWYTRDLTAGIMEVGADRDNCMIQWEVVREGAMEALEDYTDASNYRHIPSVTQFFDCLAYFDTNIFINHNMDQRDVCYNRQQIPEDAQQQKLLEEMAECGYPEFFIGHTFVLGALPIDEEMPNYAPVYRFEVYKPDKFIIDYNDRYIYAREDIYQQRSDWPIQEQLKVN